MRGDLPTIVIVPGLRDHVADHWQTLLAQQLPHSVTVSRLAADRLSCPAWIDQIEQTLADLQQNGWLPVPRTRPPFPSVVAASTNDPLASYERVAGYAADWGGRLVSIGAVGHLNPAAGYGAWPRARELIRDLGG